MLRFFKKHDTFKTTTRQEQSGVVTFTIAVVYSESGSAHSYARHECLNRAYAHLKDHIERAIPENAQCTVVSSHKPE